MLKSFALERDDLERGAREGDALERDVLEESLLNETLLSETARRCYRGRCLDSVACAVVVWLRSVVLVAQADMLLKN